MWWHQVGGIEEQKRDHDWVLAVVYDFSLHAKRLVEAGIAVAERI